MNLLNFILLGILSISTVTEAARLRPKNGRGTRQNLSKNVGYNRRRSSPEYLKRSDLSSTSTCNGCVTASSAEITAPKKNIWHGLTNEEAGDVAQFLFKSAEFKLVPTQNATEWNNTLYVLLFS